MSASSENPTEPTTYKERLDQVAREARQPARDNNNSPSLVQKVADYIPVASKFMGTENKAQEKQGETSSEDTAAPPFRPVHDEHIAEFVREQHRSKKPDGSFAA
ncbi:hypothetical protein F4808DRAFT_426410 [Astrocystis sublimbata]|nr:hypothetical protein F4808DRAFT_426410 [Astrocystis sublimbata]